MRPGSSQGRRAAIVGGALSLFCLAALMWGSAPGTSVLSTPSSTAELPKPDLRRAPPPPDATVATELEEGMRRRLESTSSDTPWEWLIIAAVLLAVLTLLVRWLLALTREPAEPDDADEDADDMELLLEATSARARARARAEGDPRNAVVACWVALEDAAERGGMERDPAETSLEFTARVLQRWEVDPATIEDLAALYREARFSAHPVGEEQRHRAVEELERIHDQLRRRRDEPVELAAEAESPS